MGNNKQNRFQEAFERGQEGQISSYDAWLQNQGFEPDRVNHEYITEYLQKNPEEAPNHDDQLEEIAEFLGFFSQRSGNRHIPVIGPTGIGKTQLLHTVSHMIDQLGLDLPHRFFSTKEFVEEGENETRFYEILDEVEELETAVILLDDCEHDKRIDHSLGKLNDRIDDLFVITSWTPEHWRIEQDRANEALTVSKEAELTTLSEKNTAEALAAAVEVYSNGGVDLQRELYSQICESSLGIPKLFHDLLRETLRQSFIADFSSVRIEAVYSAVEKLDLDNVRERVYDISDKKMLILKHILLARHPKGRRPSELVERLDRDKSTISYHLQNLVENRILEKEKQGRSAFYRVNDSVKPVLQRRIEKEGEFYA